MSLKNKYERVIIRNNMSLGLSSCAYEYLLNLEQENQQLEEKIKQYENPEDLTLMFMYCEKNAKDKIKELQQQLKQRDEVIDETIKFCNYLLENDEVEIDNEKYFKHSCDDIITNAILKKLQKYKGDNK